MELWDVRDYNGKVTGEKAIRGQVLKPGEYHLVVCIILRTPEGQYLISKRAKNRPGEGLWEVVGGSVTAGENSITGALREVKEEVGLTISETNLELLSHRSYDYPMSFILDVYRYVGPINMAEVVPQLEEVEEVALVDEDHLLELMTTNRFFNTDFFEKHYLDWKI